MFRCRKLEQAEVKLSEVSRKLIAAGGRLGCASAEELINKMYPNRLQDQVDALSVLQNRYDQLTQVKPQPVYKSNAAAASTLQTLERDLNGYKQTMVNIIESAEASDGSDLDVFNSSKKNFEDAGNTFLDTGHILCDKGKRLVMHVPKNR